jgi:hypothetical protein
MRLPSERINGKAGNGIDCRLFSFWKKKKAGLVILLRVSFGRFLSPCRSQKEEVASA